MIEILETLQTLLTNQTPQKAGAIVWLQGDRFDRGPKVLQLYQAGLAPIIIITGNNVLVGNGPRPGENDAPLPELGQWLTQRGVPEEAIMYDEHSHNTAEQARAIIALARQKNWNTILLVSSPYHQVRVFLAFLKAMQNEQSSIKIINQSADLSWEETAGGRSITARELWQMEQIKIKQYTVDLAEPESGIAYLQQL